MFRDRHDARRAAKVLVLPVKVCGDLGSARQKIPAQLALTFSSGYRKIEFLTFSSNRTFLWFMKPIILISVSEKRK